jgi:hypothetical protein
MGDEVGAHRESLSKAAEVGPETGDQWATGHFKTLFDATSKEASFDTPVLPGSCAAVRL